MLNLLLLNLSLVGLMAYFYRQFDKDIIAPPFVMATMFFISAFCALLNAGAWKIEYSFLAYFYLVSGILVFAAPSLYYQKQPVLNSYVTPDRYLNISKWKMILTIVLNALILIIFWLKIREVVIEAGYGSMNMQAAYRELVSYRDRVSVGGVVKVLVRIIDVSAYIFGYTFLHNYVVYRYVQKKDWLLLVAPVQFVLKTLLSGGRLDLLKIAAAYILMVYVLQKRKVGWHQNISKRYIKVGFIGVLVGLPLFYYTLFLTGRSTTRSLWQSISTYLGGSIQHFNQYVQKPAPHHGILGEESFVAILNILGKLKLIPYHSTVHLEYRKLGITVGNVYTFFRRPLHDFGPIGMYIFVILVGLLFAFYYYCLIRHKKPGFLLDVSTVVYAYFFYWVFLSSIEQYSFSAMSVFSVVFVVLTLALAYFYWAGDWDFKNKRWIQKSQASIRVERNR